jgi:hypothetical protein
MERTGSSKTLAYKNLTPRKFPKDYILHAESSRNYNTSVRQMFQADGEGYLDAEKTTKIVKADNQWGPIFTDKDSLISRCVAFSNSFAKGRYNFFIVYSIYV